MITEIELNREIENFYCPLTGKQVLFPDDYSTSPALLFIYIPEAEVFEYASEKFKLDFQNEFNEDGDAKSPVKFFESLKKNQEWGSHKLIVTHGVCSSVSLCFDMEFEPESNWTLFKR